MFQHEIHLLGRNLFGSDNQVALVFAVFIVEGNFFEGGDNFVANLLAALIAYSLTLKKVAMNMEIIDEAGLIARIIPNSSSRFYFPTFCQLDHFQVREVSGFDAESNEGSYLVKAIDACRSRIDV